MSARWTATERSQALARAEREGVDLLVIGGGITGAGVLRDAATRGLRALLVERDDFAAGTSSRSSKLIHGGLRYIGEGHLGMTREACRERDLMVRLNPHLVHPIPFLFTSYAGGKVRPWELRAAMWIYYALANFRRSARFRMLRPDAVLDFCHDLRAEGLHGGAVYWDAQVDDARLVLETLRSARRLGAEAANHTEVIELVHEQGGRVVGARVRDRLAERTLGIRAHTVVNAAGPGIDRVRGLDHFVAQPELRPAKGVHIVIPRGRIHSQGAITFESRDRRHLFFIPWENVAILGTTDTFTDEIDEPHVTIDEVHYLLAAANDAFPRAALTTNDIRSVFAGVRPLVAPADAATPPSSVSREHRVYEDGSGLISAAGGKLTTYRAVAEDLVDRAVRRLPAFRRKGVGPSRTRRLALRDDDFDADDLREGLVRRFGVEPERAAYLVRTYGADSESLMSEAAPELHEGIGGSHFTYAEVAWSFQTECPVTLCDVLERRLRLAIFAVGQGLPELQRIAETAARTAGWDPERTRAEAAAYGKSVRRSYQIVARGLHADRSAA